MEGPDQTNPCAICLGGKQAGGGQATFTAECSHTFHFSCISASVAHGNLVCPLCNAHWRDLPFMRPTPVPPPPPPPPVPIFQRPPRPTPPVQPTPVPPPMTPPVRRTPVPPPPPPPVRPTPVPILQRPRPRVDVFDDDEQVEPASGVPDSRPPHPAGAASNEAVVLNTHTEWSAVASDSSSHNFAVLVHVKAPGIIDTDATPRAPLDLVTVLDVSGSMKGHRLALLKQAMRFVIDNLGPNDRLSIVSFSSQARLVTRLTRMTDAGKDSCVSAVKSLVASGGTNVAAGLRTAAKVLDKRRHRNAVSSVVLLSDGQDTYTLVRGWYGGGANYEALVPPAFRRTGGEWSAPIHTFGFGNDHDATAMHVIAEATGGTFSYIENEAVIQDAFAQCIGGLLSVVVQEARIAVASGHYESRVDEDGRAGSVRVGELYADEERRFLLFLAVPRAEESEGDNTALVKVIFSYRDAASGLAVSVTAKDVVVARPEHAGDAERSAEVERERMRVEAVEDIVAASVAAERDDHEEAVEILENRQRLVAQSAAARDGDPVIVALGAELREMRRRVSSLLIYRRSGRAYMLSVLSAHTQQRANSTQMLPLELLSMTVHTSFAKEAAWSSKAVPEEASKEATVSYATPAMHAMLLRSQRAREASAEQGQQQPRVGDDVTSKAVF